MLNSFPIINLVAASDLCTSAEYCKAEEGESLFAFAPLKKVQAKKQLWHSDSTYLIQNGIQTESHAVIYFGWQ